MRHRWSLAQGWNPNVETGALYTTMVSLIELGPMAIWSSSLVSPLLSHHACAIGVFTLIRRLLEFFLGRGKLDGVCAKVCTL